MITRKEKKMIDIIKKAIIPEIKVMIVIVIIVEINIKKTIIIIKMIIMKMIDIMIMITIITMIDIQIIIITEEVVEEVNFGKEKKIINLHSFLSFRMI